MKNFDKNKNRKENEVVYKDTVLNVPYYSQYLDIEDSLHKLTACGITSAYMALKYYGHKNGNLQNFVEKGKRDGGYSKSGWVHDYIVSVFTENNILCERKEKMNDGDVLVIRDHIKKGNPVIISMQRFSFDRRIFHMVLLVGIRESVEGNLEGFFYHDPAGLDKKEVSNLFVSIPVFLQYWRRMAIFPEYEK